MIKLAQWYENNLIGHDLASRILENEKSHKKINNDARKEAACSKIYGDGIKYGGVHISASAPHSLGINPIFPYAPAVNAWYPEQTRHYAYSIRTKIFIPDSKWRQILKIPSTSL